MKYKIQVKYKRNKKQKGPNFVKKYCESKYFFTKFGHFYFLFLLYSTCTSIITFYTCIYI